MNISKSEVQWAKNIYKWKIFRCYVWLPEVTQKKHLRDSQGLFSPAQSMPASPALNISKNCSMCRSRPNVFWSLRKTWSVMLLKHLNRDTNVEPERSNANLVGGWTLPVLKIWVRQLGWLFPIYGKMKNVPNHQQVLQHMSEGLVWRGSCCLVQSHFLRLRGWTVFSKEKWSAIDLEVYPLCLPWELQ